MRKILIFLSFLSFILSLFYEVGNTEKGTFLVGFVCFMFGWMGYHEWLANPLLFLCYTTTSLNLSKWVNITILSIALLLALSFIFRTEILINEAGMTETIVDFGDGYRLWVISIFLLLLSNFFKEIPKE